MALRIVVYAEGAAETCGAESRLPAPGEPLSGPHLGPLHRLVARCVRDDRPQLDVTFLSPLRTQDATTVRGSMLRDRPRELRRLLTFPDPRRRPELAVVLVDQDGDRGIRLRLRDAAGDSLTPWVLAVPIPEFEAWLLADVVTASRILGRPLDRPPDPESLACGAAKQLFFIWSTGGTTLSTTPDLRTIRRDARIEILEHCSLDLLCKLRSFEDFQADLRDAVRRISA